MSAPIQASASVQVVPASNCVRSSTRIPARQPGDTGVTVILGSLTEVGRVLMGTLSEYLGLRLALALGATVSGGFWLVTRFQHKRMAAGLEGPPITATEGRA